MRGLHGVITSSGESGAAPAQTSSTFVLGRAVGGEVSFAYCETPFRVFAEARGCFIAGVKAKHPLCPGSARPAGSVGALRYCPSLPRAEHASPVPSAGAADGAGLICRLLWIPL